MMVLEWENRFPSVPYRVRVFSATRDGDPALGADEIAGVRRNAFAGQDDPCQVQRVGRRDRKIGCSLPAGAVAEGAQRLDRMRRCELLAGKARNESTATNLPARLQAAAGQQHVIPGSALDSRSSKT